MKHKELIELIETANLKMPEQFKVRITYRTHLLADEWSLCRDKILMRDNYCCTNCKAKWNLAYIIVNREGDQIKYLIKGEWFDENEYLKWRDENKNNPYITLQVHHKYYQTNKLPWEYPDEALQSLCVKCHKKEHKKKVIPVFDENMEISNT